MIADLSKKLAEDFKNHLTGEGKSRTTILSYVGDVKGFLHWLKKRK